MSKDPRHQQRIAEPHEARADAINQFYAHKIKLGSAFEIEGHSARFTAGHRRGILFEFWPFKHTNAVKAEWCAPRLDPIATGCAV